jgi:nucleoporin SEH1
MSSLRVFTSRSAVGRVEWNITGCVTDIRQLYNIATLLNKYRFNYRTVLSSAGNDGRIRLWKATSGSVWRPAGSIGVEQAEEHGHEDTDVDMDSSTRKE